MRRDQKLVEAMAIVNQIRAKLSRELDGLKFDQKTRDEIFPIAKTAIKELDRLHETLEERWQDETGLTEAQKWENAARVFGRVAK